MNTSNGTKMWVMQTQQIKIKRREPGLSKWKSNKGNRNLVFDQEEDAK
jgi:hypothetical protein